MELPDGDVGAFYRNELPHLTEPIVPHEEAPTVEEMSTGVMKTFSSVKRRQQYSTGTWRDPADQTDDEIFQATVIDMLRNGGKYHPKLDKNLIEDDYIRAYLIRPATVWNEGPDGVGYPKQWAQIRTTVGELVPKLQDTSLWTEIPYNMLNNDDPELDADEGTNGKNLFKYNPLHIFESGLKGPLAMLWVEDKLTPYHEDHW
ncbi:hypothetical protein BDV23DRAFT_178615 [Aspergillus alliaceus]|uniref:Uncharacterized protein n=1 Tax=Petromyces alliaceus TaxID=209559 RepID=A0A5N7CPW7_PETAA|nr:hypothetical protein BDV23DRAFT_178615 [Aspergillus alliaceus]